MLKGIDNDGNLQNVNVSEDGAIKVFMEGEGNTDNDIETTLLSEVLTIGTTTTEKLINKKIISIMVANYSETSDVSIVIGNDTLKVGANLALELPINTQISSFNMTATEDETKVQLVVKGVK